jgi:predicted nucleotide-binding protein (sugar kinase/HSP70/actin superfamily)
MDTFISPQKRSASISVVSHIDTCQDIVKQVRTYEEEAGVKKLGENLKNKIKLIAANKRIQKVEEMKK